jgi:hypothetical protein
MSIKLQTRAEAAGYPGTLFSFHSLRGGFMSASLVKAEVDADSIDTTLRDTALIAGWTIAGKSQLCYVKEHLRSSLVATRMVVPTAEGETDSRIDPNLMTPERFHKLELNSPKDMIRVKKERLYDAIEEKFSGLIKEMKEDELWVKRHCWTFACKDFEEEFGLHGYVLMECVKHDRWKDTSCRSSVREGARKKVVVGMLI